MNLLKISRTNAYLLLIITLTLLVRAPAFNMDYANIDENEYSIAAMKLLTGGLPYRDFLIYQPPVIYYFYALAFKIFGVGHIWGAHILLDVVMATTLTVIFSTAKLLWNSEKTALLAAAIYGFVTFSFIPQDMLGANCELVANLPIALAIFFIVKAFKNDKVGLIFALLSGIFASFAFLTKYQCGIILIPPLLYSIVTKRSVKAALMILLGFTIPILAVIAFFHAKGSLNETVDAFLYITKYAKGPVQSTATYVLIKFFVRSLIFMFAGFGCWYLCLRGLFAGVKPKLLFVSWFFLSFIPVIAGGRIYFHYYLIAVPCAALLAAGTTQTTYVSRAAKILMLTLAAISMTTFLSYDIYKPFKKAGVKDQWQFVAQYLKDNAKPDQSLFVWGYAPQIYISSGLRPSTRFTTADYLTGKTPATAGLEYDPNTTRPPSALRKVLNDFIDPPGVVIFDTSSNVFPKAWDYLKEDFQKELPTYVVDTAPSNYRRYARYPMKNYPYLINTIDDNYELVQNVSGFDIYKLKGTK